MIVAKAHVTNAIRTLRFHANEMTQQDLADRVGVTDGRRGLCPP